MPILGAHMSIAGGYYRAIELARAVQCDCVQVFTKNNNQWKAKPITDDEATRFRNTLRELRIDAPLSHTSYLINVASPDPNLVRQSIDAMVVELQRAGQLGIPFVVLHPGSFTTSTEAQGLATVVRSLNEVFQQTPELSTVCLLENTAGQGSNLGWRFEHLAEIQSQCQYPERLGVCIDTCHTFAAGYPLSAPNDYQATMKTFDDVVGLDRVKAIHLNDSKMPFGSRRDRHEHIGRGSLGLQAFQNLLNDSRWSNVPMYLETEKGTENGEELDAINLRVLRSLCGGGQMESKPRSAIKANPNGKSPLKPTSRKILLSKTPTPKDSATKQKFARKATPKRKSST